MYRQAITNYVNVELGKLSSPSGTISGGTPNYQHGTQVLLTFRLIDADGNAVDCTGSSKWLLGMDSTYSTGHPDVCYITNFNQDFGYDLANGVINARLDLATEEFDTLLGVESIKLVHVCLWTLAVDGEDGGNGGNSLLAQWDANVINYFSHPWGMTEWSSSSSSSIT